MSDELLPTAANFDAIVAANEAKLNGNDSANVADTSAASDVGADSDASLVDDGATETDDAGSSEQAEPDAADAATGALAAAKNAGIVTPELMQEIGDLDVEVTINGEVRSVKLKELQGGYMRQAHFQRSMEKANAKAAQAEQIFEIERARTNSWRNDPNQLYNGLMAMGVEGNLRQIFLHWVQEEHAYLSASPSERQQMDYNKQLRQQNAQIQARAAELERQQQRLQQQQPTQVDEATATAYRYIEQNMDRELGAAFKAVGVGKVTPHALILFQEELTGYAKAGYSVQDAVREAASAVADRFLETRQVASGKTPTPSPRKAPPGKVPARDANSGQFVKGNNKANKPPPTAAEFGKRFGI